MTHGAGQSSALKHLETVYVKLPWNNSQFFETPCVLTVESPVIQLHASVLPAVPCLVQRRMCFQNETGFVSEELCAVVCCKAERIVVNKTRRTDSSMPAFQGARFHILSLFYHHMLMKHGYTYS